MNEGAVEYRVICSPIELDTDRCLLGGDHRAGSPYATQCPPRTAEQRAARAKEGR